VCDCETSNPIKTIREISRLFFCGRAGIALLLAIILAPTIQTARAQTFKVLYTFTVALDGATPLDRPLLLNGKLYGTTSAGGSGNSGTVFVIDIKSGQETTLYTFTGSSDGSTPYADLISDGVGNLYGTALGGGANNRGTVFELSPSGVPSVLHSFGGGHGGVFPYAGVIPDSSGNLYGTTFAGGAGGGTVFKLDTAGNLTMLRNFSSGTARGPRSDLLLEHGVLYGTTELGGSYNKGTVFKVHPSTGKGKILYNFTGGIDGLEPLGGLVGDGIGNLYGTTVGSPQN
jgi:uncharacterized repeat protein (TIGR03803 family)